MSGFATGFQRGFGVAQNYVDSKRQDERARQELALREKRDKQNAEYQAGLLETQREAIEVRERARRDRVAADMRETARFAADAAADARNRRIDYLRRAPERKRAAELETERIRELKLENDRIEMERRRETQIEALRLLPSYFSGRGTKDDAIAALRALEGSPLHPSNALGGEFARRLEVAQQFASGERQDFRSADFLEAVNFALDADTSLIRGLESPRPGMGEIVDANAIQVVPSEDGSGLHVLLSVRARGGTYNAWMTKGRSLNVDGEPAVIPVEHLTDRIGGLAAYRKAWEVDPNFKASFFELIRESNPEAAEDARRRAARRYGDAAKAYAGMDEFERQGVKEPVYQDFLDEEYAATFGSPPGPGSDGGDGGEGTVSFFDLEPG